MAFKLADRVAETSTTSGTGTFDLQGAIAGFQPFIDGVGASNTTYYSIVSPATGQWEVGQGTIILGTGGAPNRLARDIVFEGSSGVAVKVAFANVATPKEVFCTLPADKVLFADVSGGWIVPGTLEVSDAALFDSSLDVVGAVTLDTTLSVAGATVLGTTLAVASTSSFGGLMTLNAGLHVHGNSTLESLTVEGAATVGTTLGVNGGLTVGGVLNLTGAATFGGTLGVTGGVSLAATLGVAGNTTIGGALGAGASTLASLHVTGTTALDGGVTFGSAVSLPGTTTLVALHATGASGLDGAVTLGATLGVAGAATLSSTLGVTGAVTLNSTLSAAATTLSTLHVTGISGLDGAVTLGTTLAVTGAATLSNTLSVAGNVAINTNKFTVAAATGNTTIAGTLVIGGDPGGSELVRINGSMRLFGGLTTASTMDSQVTSGGVLSATSATTGALFQQFQNTNGYMLLGLERSIGGQLFTGTTADSAVFGTSRSKAVHFATNNIVRMTIEAGGGFVFGTDPGSGDSVRIGGSVRSGTVTIGNGQFFSARRASGALDVPLLGFSSGTDLIVLGHAASLPQINIASGSVSVGTDPGGSELLRVGGNARLNGSLTATVGTFASSVVSGGVTSGGGNYRCNDDGGTQRWFMGILGAAGTRAWSVYDLVRGVEVISIDHVTGGVRFGNVGFNGAGAIAAPTVSGSRGGNAALANLLAALATYGLIVNGTSA